MLNRTPHGRGASRGRERDAGPELATDLVRLRIAAGAMPGDLACLPPRARRAATVAVEVGAPLSEALDGAAAAEADVRRAQRAVAVASAQTRVVAGGLLAAPVVLVPLLGALVGADLVGFYGSPLGLAVGAAGLGLLLTGALLVLALVRRVGRAAPPGRQLAPALLAAAAAGWLLDPLIAPFAFVLVARGRPPAPAARDVDEAADLTATALAGGVPAASALRLAADELPDLAASLRALALDLELGLDGDDPVGDGDTGLARLRAVIRTATEVGTPAAPTLRRLAADLRADDLARVLAAAERLPAQLTFPTALCLLPATVLLVGAPIVHAGLAAAGT